MHEVSIVEELLLAVQREMQNHAGARVRVVRMEAGALRQVEPAIMEFCYRAAVTGTALEGSRVEIEPVPAAARCGKCNLEFPVQENWFECPRCQSTDSQVLRGNELRLTSIEIEEAPVQQNAVSHSHVHCHS